MANESGPNEEAPPEASASPETTLPPSDILEIEPVYEALGHPRRRYLCYTLLENTEWSLTDLARKIAAWENDVPDHAVTEDQREEVYIALYHAHVPKLVDEGVITFDGETERISTAEHAEQALTALEAMGASLDSNQETHARSEMNDEEN